MTPEPNDSREAEYSARFRAECGEQTMADLRKIIRETPEAFWVLLPAEEKLALLRAAPRVAGAWTEHLALNGRAWKRLDARYGEAAAVFDSSDDGRPWWRAVTEDCAVNYAPTFAEAIAAAEASLLARGWTLTPEPAGDR